MIDGVFVFLVDPCVHTCVFAYIFLFVCVCAHMYLSVYVSKNMFGTVLQMKSLTLRKGVEERKGNICSVRFT